MKGLDRRQMPSDDRLTAAVHLVDGGAKRIYGAAVEENIWNICEHARNIYYTAGVVAVTHFRV